MFIIVRNSFFWNTRDFGNNAFNVMTFYRFLLLFIGQNTLGGTSFVHNINCFIGQKAFIHITRRQFCCGLQCFFRVFHLMKGFKHGFQALQNLHRFRHAGFKHINFLKTAAQSMVFIKNSAKLIISSCTNTAQFAFCQSRFQ